VLGNPCQAGAAALRIAFFCEMTKRAVHCLRSLESRVALCVVLLQLLSSLHFALIPHGFGGHSGGLIHLRGTAASKSVRALNSSATRPAPESPALVSRIASCEPEACPLGFSGQLSRPFLGSALSQIICLPAPHLLAGGTGLTVSRSRSLLSAPKTSPPILV